MNKGSSLQSLLPVVSRLLSGLSFLFCFLFYSERWTEGGRKGTDTWGWDQKVGCPSTSWTFDCQESGGGAFLTQTKAQWHHTKGILMSLLSSPQTGRLFPASLSTLVAKRPPSWELTASQAAILKWRIPFQTHTLVGTLFWTDERWASPAFPHAHSASLMPLAACGHSPQILHSQPTMHPSAVQLPFQGLVAPCPPRRG